MQIEMSFLLLAFATVLAPLAQGQSTPPQPKITGVLTILTPKPGVTVEQVMKIMPAEIRATVPLFSGPWCETAQTFPRIHEGTRSISGVRHISRSGSPNCTGKDRSCHLQFCSESVLRLAWLF